MKMLAILITACVVLAAAQAVAAVLVVLVLAALAYGLFSAPRETMGFLGLTFVTCLIVAQPLATLAMIGLAVVAKIFNSPD